MRKRMRKRRVGKESHINTNINIRTHTNTHTYIHTYIQYIRELSLTGKLRNGNDNEITNLILNLNEFCYEN